MRRSYCIQLSLLVTMTALAAVAGDVRITVDAAAPGVAVSPQLFGIFFEDINFGADGGLSAELVKNGSFEFADAITGWRKIENRGAVGGFGIRSERPAFRNNPQYARIAVEEAGDGFGLRNEGYRGMGLRKEARYRFSAMARLVSGAPQPLRVELLGSRDAVIGSGDVQVTASEWTRVGVELSSSATELKGALRLTLRRAGEVDLDAVSLMPVDTWMGRENGLRPDLVKMLADLKPGFIRFPGGCIVEGRTLANRYRWKDTVGPVDDRKLIYNRWNVEFAGSGHGAHDYYQSFRVGFFEYFQLCEDLHAKPLPILNCGMACQYNSGELAPTNAMDEYVQDALDLVEFANGSTNGTWGRVRAEMGHPAPFGLTMLGVGNEQWGPQYFERYAIVARALRSKYPDIKLVASAGPGPDGERFDAAWRAFGGLSADIVDEHCYSKPEWFLDNADRFDRQARRGPKVFMGEYAAHDANKHSTWRAALAEAAFMTGLERNADVVAMSSYAPLFAHVDAWQWSVNLIWFDNLVASATPEYCVQRLFAAHRPDIELPAKIEGAPPTGGGKSRIYACAGRDSAAHELILKVVNATDAKQTATLVLRGVEKVGTAGRATVLAAEPASENPFNQPARVVPQEEPLKGVSAEFTREFAPQSVTVLRLPI